MVHRILLSLALVLVFVAPLRAGPERVSDLIEALQFDRLLEVMAEEGRRYGADLDADVMGGGGMAGWTQLVAQIHSVERMRKAVANSLHRDLDDHPDAVEAMVGFFRSDLGAQIVTLELSAREALLDEAVKEAAELVHEDMRAARDPRLRQLERFAEVNDLIESNVSGAMNSNLAFFRGMVAGGAEDPGMSETDLLADLWSREPQIRADTEKWLYPYLSLAYQPLTEATLDTYIAFSMTAEGQRLNTALFAAFDALFTMLSYDLGFAAAQFMKSEEL